MGWGDVDSPPRLQLWWTPRAGPHSSSESAKTQGGCEGRSRAGWPRTLRSLDSRIESPPPLVRVPRSAIPGPRIQLDPLDLPTPGHGAVLLVVVHWDGRTEVRRREAGGMKDYDRPPCIPPGDMAAAMQLRDRRQDRAAADRAGSECGRRRPRRRIGNLGTHPTDFTATTE